MLEYHDNKLCIPVKDLIEEGIMTDSKYRYLLRHNKISSARQGKGLGNYALVVVNSLPYEYKDQITRIYPNGDKVLLLGWLKDNYERDQNALVFFMNKEKTGVELTDEKINEYVANASVLNTCIKLYGNAKAIQKTMGEKYDWAQMTQAIEGLRELYGHTLPASTLRFRKKVAEYKSNGYASLISGKFGNQNKRKVDFKTVRLVICIAAQPNKPYNTNVWELYNSFVCGEYEVYDPETGEVFNTEDYTDKNGDPKSLSESTICNILNNPQNKLLIDHAQLKWTSFMHEQAPHMHRHNGNFSFSQITMDDVDLQRKMKGNQYVHAYYASDVVSQCRIGVAYSRGKDDSLVVDCFRDMFRLIERNGWGMPAGIEVENHLMSKYKEGFLKAGNVFKFVRFCAPQNSQEKYQEALNGAYKKSIVHKNHIGIGRFYAKDRHNRTESKKISDETNVLYEDYQYYSWEQLVAEDRADCKEWNNTLHPNQKKYPGMTRWDVLVANINPTLLPYDKQRISKYIGEKVSTSVRRNSTVRVCYEDWWLSKTEDLGKLEPNNYKVDAYYLPDEEGKPVDVYLYQGEKFICKVEKVETYNRVMAEQTEEDKRIFTDQQKRIAGFRKFIADNEVKPVGILKKEKETKQPESELEIIEIVCVESPPEENYSFEGIDYSSAGVGDA